MKRVVRIKTTALVRHKVILTSPLKSVYGGFLFLSCVCTFLVLAESFFSFITSLFFLTLLLLFSFANVSLTSPSSFSLSFQSPPDLSSNVVAPPDFLTRCVGFLYMFVGLVDVGCLEYGCLGGAGDRLGGRGEWD